MLAALTLPGCASPQPGPTRTETIRVPVPVWEPIPERYIQPLQVPALAAPLDNEALESDITRLEQLVERCQADRASLRRIQQRRGSQ